MFLKKFVEYLENILIIAMTKEQENFVLAHFGVYSFRHLSSELCVSISEIQEFIRSCKKFKPHIPYKNRSKEWKDEVAEYLSNHSISKTCVYFCISDTIVNKVRKEYNIQLMNRSDTLKVSRVENYGSWDNYKSFMIENTKRTSQERYGVDNYATTAEAKEKIRSSCLARYGVDNPMRNEDIKQRLQNTNLLKRGVPWPQQDKNVLKKRLETCTARYAGVGWASKEIYLKSQETVLQRYGVEHDMQSPEIKNKVNETCLSKYGVMWPCLTDNCRTYMRDSGPNRAFAELLSNLHIEYEREFTIHHFAYDFRVNDMLIEIDPTPTHNSTWGIFKEQPTSRDYHNKKTQFAQDNGFKCIHIWDWDNVNSVIQTLTTRPTIYARNCILKEVNSEDEQEYLKAHHLQGYVKSSVSLGLYYSNKLVSLMTFGKPRYNKNYEYELLRYCAHYNVIGGAEKLFKYFVKKYSPESIISYCDRSKFQGKVYDKLGFKFVTTNIGKHWYNMKTGKHITDNLLRQRGFDQLLGKEYGYYGKGTSNEELMLKHGFVEIYDAGQATYIWNNSCYM